jgi:hypothetical protein
MLAELKILFIRTFERDKMRQYIILATIAALWSIPLQAGGIEEATMGLAVMLNPPDNN